MDFVSVVLMGVGLSMDAFAVSIASGVTMRPVRFPLAIKIAAFFGGFQFLMPIAGYALGSLVIDYIRAYDHWVAFALLLFIGGKMIIEAIRPPKEAENRDPANTGTLLVLAIATSIDALAVGISLAVMQASILASAVIIGAVTLFICLFGVLAGEKLGGMFGNKAEIAGGLVLIGIGLKILIEHMGL